MWNGPRQNVWRKKMAFTLAIREERRRKNLRASLRMMLQIKTMKIISLFLFMVYHETEVQSALSSAAYKLANYWSQASCKSVRSTCVVFWQRAKEWLKTKFHWEMKTLTSWFSLVSGNRLRFNLSVILISVLMVSRIEKTNLIDHG